MRVVRVKGLPGTMHPVIFFNENDDESRERAWRKAKAEMAGSDPSLYVTLWKRPIKRFPIPDDVPVIGEGEYGLTP